MGKGVLAWDLILFLAKLSMQGKGSHKDGEKPRSRSNQRRKLKSPIRIKEKIKELEDKLARPLPFKRHKVERQPPSPVKDSTPTLPRHDDPPSPFRKTAHHFQVRSSERPSLFSPARLPRPSKRPSDYEDHSFFPAPVPPPKLGRIHSHRDLPSVREEESLQRLKAEN
jgi:hypothetical protein